MTNKVFVLNENFTVRYEDTLEGRLTFLLNTLKDSDILVAKFGDTVRLAIYELNRQNTEINYLKAEVERLRGLIDDDNLTKSLYAQSYKE